MSDLVAINPDATPSGIGCLECEVTGGWWWHLRRCAECGHIGCCDDSLGKHATAHATEAGHPVIRSFEPGEDWFYNYATNRMSNGPSLAPPEEHPLDQPAPGPAHRVPADWERRLSD
jgi:hypothetical protein